MYFHRDGRHQVYTVLIQPPGLSLRGWWEKDSADSRESKYLKLLMANKKTLPSNFPNYKDNFSHGAIDQPHLKSRNFSSSLRETLEISSFVFPVSSTGPSLALFPWMTALVYHCSCELVPRLRAQHRVALEESRPQKDKFSADPVFFRTPPLFIQV